METFRIVLLVLETTSEGPTTTPEPPLTWFECPDQYSYHPHPANCTQYIICVFGKAYLRACEGGLHWSTQLKNCDWPNPKTTCQQVDDNTAYRPEASPVYTPPPAQPSDESSSQYSSDYQPETQGRYGGSQAFNHFKPDEDAAKDQLTNFAGKKVVYGEASQDFSPDDSGNQARGPDQRTSDGRKGGIPGYQDLAAQGSTNARTGMQRKNTAQQDRPVNQVDYSQSPGQGQPLKMSQWDIGNEDFSHHQEQRLPMLSNSDPRKYGQNPRKDSKKPSSDIAPSGPAPPWAAMALQRKKNGQAGGESSGPAERYQSRPAAEDSYGQQQSADTPPYRSAQGKHRPSAGPPSSSIGAPPPWAAQATQTQQQSPRPSHPNTSSKSNNPWGSDTPSRNEDAENGVGQPGGYGPPIGRSGPRQQGNSKERRGPIVLPQTYEPDADNGGDDGSAPVKVNPAKIQSRPAPSRNRGPPGSNYGAENVPQSKPYQPQQYSGKQANLNGPQDGSRRSPSGNNQRSAQRQPLPPRESQPNSDQAYPSAERPRQPPPQGYAPGGPTAGDDDSTAEQRSSQKSSYGQTPPDQADRDAPTRNPWRNSAQMPTPSHSQVQSNQAPRSPGASWSGSQTSRQSSAIENQQSRPLWSDNADDESNAESGPPESVNGGFPNQPSSQNYVNINQQSRRRGSADISRGQRTSDGSNDDSGDQTGPSAQSMPRRVRDFGGSQEHRLQRQRMNSFDDSGESSGNLDQGAPSNYEELFYRGL